MNNTKKNLIFTIWLKKNNTLVRFLIGIVSLFLLFLVLIFFSSQTKNYFHIVSYPIEKKIWQAGQSTSEFLASLLHSKSLLKENEDLKNENQKLLSQIIFLQTIKKANEDQEKISTYYHQNSDFKLIMAEVIGLDAQDELTINKGLEDGVTEEMPVIGPENVLFGKVIKVYKNFSKVTLISNKNSIINVKVQKKDHDLADEVYGVIKGNGGGNVYLDLIPIDEVVNQNDILVTSALEGIFPKNLLVGKIIEVKKNDQSPYQQAQVKPFFNIKTDNLFIISNYKR